MGEQSTEDKIREAARKVFVRDGMSGARMQEIADEAGINKALLHYYYRSKEQLFNAVFEEVLKNFVPKLFETLNSELPLEVKIYQISERYTYLLLEHRDLPLFILTELQRNPERLLNKIPSGRMVFSKLENQLKEEASRGNIQEIPLEMFVINLISMLVFPFAARALYKGVMGMTDEAYLDFVKARMLFVPKFFMNALRP